MAGFAALPMDPSHDSANEIRFLLQRLGLSSEESLGLLYQLLDEAQPSNSSAASEVQRLLDELSRLHGFQPDDRRALLGLAISQLEALEDIAGDLGV